MVEKQQEEGRQLDGCCVNDDGQNCEAVSVDLASRDYCDSATVVSCETSPENCCQVQQAQLPGSVTCSFYSGGN